MPKRHKPKKATLMYFTGNFTIKSGEGRGPFYDIFLKQPRPKSHVRKHFEERKHLGR